MDRGLGNRRVLCLVDSRVVLGSVCKGRSSSRRVNFRHRRLGGLCQQTICRSTCVEYPFGQIPGTPSKMKDILCIDNRRNDLESHILSLRDKSAMSGENGISSSSANLGRSVEHWRRLDLLRSGDVEPNPGLPSGRVSRRRRTPQR